MGAGKTHVMELLDENGDAALYRLLSALLSPLFALSSLRSAHSCPLPPGLLPLSSFVRIDVDRIRAALPETRTYERLLCDLFLDLSWTFPGTFP